jgi:DNA repair protein RadA/Sms
MAKASRAFVCQACGAVSPRWAGQCAVCGEWNSIAEEAASLSGPAPLIAIRGGKGRPARFETLQAATIDAPRLPTGIAEFDRVTGGGLVPGSAVLVGGDPGIGKSTLLLKGPRRSPRRAPPSSTSRARRPPLKFACAPSGSG